MEAAGRLGCHVSGNFIVAEVASRIRGPDVAADRFGPNPEVAAADIQPAAGGAAAFDMALLFFELAQQRLGGVRPDGRKRALANVAETVMAPELVGVNFPIPTDAPDAAARVVPLVHLEQLEQPFAPFGVFTTQPQVEVRAVGMVVDG